MNDKLRLKIVDKVDPRLKEIMTRHYSQPKGFVGRNICYAIYYDNILYGFTVAGSVPKWLPGRDEFFNMTKANMNRIIDNIFFHIEKQDGKYPVRNFVPMIIAYWRERAALHWRLKYGTVPWGFETLVELPRTGDCYIRDGWTLVGQTKGYTCKRESGIGSDSWSGRRVWSTDPNTLRPKLVFCRKI